MTCGFQGERIFYDANSYRWLLSGVEAHGTRSNKPDIIAIDTGTEVGELVEVFNSCDAAMQARILGYAQAMGKLMKEKRFFMAEWRQAHMSDLQKLTNELMQDPEFKKEYEAIQPEVDITRAILDARIQAGLTQSPLSESPGNPSPALLKRLAE